MTKVMSTCMFIINNYHFCCCFVNLQNKYQDWVCLGNYQTEPFRILKVQISVQMWSGLHNPGLQTRHWSLWSSCTYTLIYAKQHSGWTPGISPITSYQSLKWGLQVADYSFKQYREQHHTGDCLWWGHVANSLTTWDPTQNITGLTENLWSPLLAWQALCRLWHCRCSDCWHRHILW